MKKDNIIKFYSTYKLYIFPSLVALASLFLIIFAIYPQTVKLISNQRSQGELTNRHKFLEAKVSALEKYDVLDLSQKVELALSAYPAERDFGNVIGLLQQLISQSGFNIVSIALGGSGVKAESASAYEVKVDISGSKALLPVLLNNLESSPRIMRVSSVNISSSGSQKVDVSLVISVLYSLVPKEFGTLDSPLPELSKIDEELIASLARVGGRVSPPSKLQIPRGKANPFE